MTNPVGLAELKEHLRSDDGRVRVAAMAHVCAHGEAARELAPLVARALEDPDQAVQYEATGAFRAIGRGAFEAVPDLVRMARDPHDVPMLRTRALFSLGVVGPAAASAIPTLLALAEGPDRGAAVEALVAIAGEEDTGAVAIVLEALFDSDYGVQSSTARALKQAAPWLAERAFELASEGLGDETRGPMAMAIIEALRPLFPERALALTHHAIADRLPAARMAMLTLERGGEPVPLEVARALIVLGRAGDVSAHRCLARCAERIPRAELEDEARAALVPRILEGGELRALEGWATALAALVPGEASVVEALLERLGVELQAAEPKWYPAGAIARSIGALADARCADHAGAALAAALRRSRSFLRQDESAVLDFQRSVKGGLQTLARLSEVARVAAETELEVDVVDAEHAALDAQRAAWAGTLPVIPRASAPIVGPSVRAPRKAERAELERARARAADWLRGTGLSARSKPALVAELVDVEVRSLRRKRERAPELVPLLASLYGDAIARALGWSWELWSEGDVRALAVVAPGSTHALLPGKLITAKLEPGADVTLLLLFNMLGEGRLPPSEEGALVRIG